MAYVISDDCIACGTCIDECPVEAISEGDIYSINQMYVLTVVLAQTFVRLKQFTRLNNTSYKKCTGCFLRKAAFFYFLSSPQITQMDTGYLYSTKL